MRIAVSSDNDRGLESSVSHHFGRCPFFTLVDIENGSIGSVETVENPFFSSHAPGQVPSFIRKLKAEVMLSGGMGRRAIAMFQEYGIGCATGAMTTVDKAVADFIAGRLSHAAPCSESVEHSYGDDGYETDDPAERLREEAAALLEQVDDIIVRLPGGGAEKTEGGTETMNGRGGGRGAGSGRNASGRNSSGRNSSGRNASGRSGSGGRGSGGGPYAAGPGGRCVCPACGYIMEHRAGQPCNALKCPECGAIMTRE